MSFRQVSDPLADSILKKRYNVWSIEEIKAWLVNYFKYPKQFTKIHKSLPNKTIAQIIRFFYLMKYAFRLKKCLRK
jgi:hypothetical protein